MILFFYCFHFRDICKLQLEHDKRKCFKNKVLFQTLFENKDFFSV